MSVRMNSVATLLAAGTAALAIVVAPSAAASVQSNCSAGGPDTECVTPGNAQIDDALPPDFAPQYPDFSLFGFGRHDGGHR